jgi:iron complex outermembrane receptor protein
MHCSSLKNCVVVFCLGVAFAGSGSPTLAAAGDENSSSGPAEISEITVTAEKRSESANRVGLTIVAITGDALERENIHNVADLARVVPGLTYTNSFTEQPVYTIRGIGFYESSLSAYPAVSVYVDQVALPFPVLTTSVGLDLERVEVLKGPQGILFGQNSTGGAINYIARKPTDTLEAGFSFGGGRFRDVLAHGYLSGPLSDTVKARFSYQVETADGWQHPYFRPQPGTNGAVSKYAVRLLVDWNPSDRLRFELNLTGSEDQSEPIAPQKVGVKLAQAGSPINGPFLVAYPNAPANAQAADWSLDNEPKADNPMGQVSLRGDYDLTNDVTLTSISSFIRFYQNDRIEYGGTDSDANEFAPLRGQINSFTQELRLANAATNALRWLVGGNYEHSDVDESLFEDYAGSTTADTLGTLGNPNFSDQKMRNYAGFGNIDYDLTSQFTVKAGARYTESDRAAASCNLAGSSGVGPLFDALTNILNPTYTLNQPPLLPTDCIQFALVSTDPVRGPLYLPTRAPLYTTLNQNNVSWRAGMDFKATPDELYYVNITKGYKAGSIPTVVALAASQFQPAKQESVLDYEGGFKFRLLDHRLQLNAAAFYYDYKDKQIRSLRPQPPVGPLNLLINIPKSRIFGGELDLQYRPVAGLLLTAGGTWLASKVTEIPPGTYNANNDPGNYQGSNLPYTPKLTMNGTADYTWSLTSKLDATVGATWSHRSQSNASLGDPSLYKINSYDLLDLRAGIATLDGKYRLEFWGKNVTNKYYWSNVVYSFDTIVRYAELPVTYGATLTVAF